MEKTINVKLWLWRFVHHWYFFVLSLLIAFGIALLVVRTTPKVYRVSSTLLLRDNSHPATQNGSQDFIKEMDIFTLKSEQADEIGVLTSVSNVQRVLSYLDFGVTYSEQKVLRSVELYKDSPFVVQIDSAQAQMLNVPIRVEIISPQKFRLHAEAEEAYLYYPAEKRTALTPLQDVTLELTGEFGKPFQHRYLSATLQLRDFEAADQEREMYFEIGESKSLAEAYASTLSATPISKGANIIQLSANGTNVEKQADFLNELMRVYIRDEQEKITRVGQRTIEFIDTQLTGVSDSLQRVEGNLQDFRASRNIMDINTASGNFTTQYTQLDNERSKLRTQLGQYELIRDYLRRSTASSTVVAPSSAGIEDPLLNELLSDLSQLNRERSALATTARQSNPVVQNLDSRIENIRATLQENVANLIEANRRSLRQIDQRIGAVQAKINQLPENERQLVNIERNYRLSDNLYNYLLEKRTEAGIALAAQHSEKSILDPARLASRKPVSPDTKKIFILALVAGLALPVALIVVRDSLSDRVMSRQDVEAVTNIPVVGVIAHDRYAHKATVLEKPKTAVAEAFRSIRIFLQRLTLSADERIIGVTSSVAGEGKSFCAINLAATYAQAGHRVILLDTDLRKSTMKDRFALKGQPGLSAYLQGKCPLEKAIVADSTLGFDLLPAGEVPENPLGLIEQPRMSALFKDLRQHYDYIVVDTPPIGLVSEYLVLLPHISYTFYVTRYNYTKVGHLKKINNLYQQHELGKVGILINGVNVKKAYAYGYYETEYGYA